MSDKTLNILSIQDKESVKNSDYRAPKRSPGIKKLSDTEIEVRTVDDGCIISKLEEAILYIIATFKFCPFWLIQQWFYSIEKNDGFEKVSSWVQVGLVWAETTSMGIFLRPTKFLFDMFKVEDEKFLEIPFGMLNHTCAEQQIVFDIQMANPESELWMIIKDEETLPVYHPLDLKFENESGTICIREGDFRLGFKRHSTEELLQREQEIRKQIKSEMKYTEEFNDFSRFPIVNFNNETQELITQTPDIIVPIPRDKGKAKSYAIEIELTPKTIEKYNNIMLNYKDNIKFGKLFYLCGSQRIAKLVKDAFKNVQGLGSCEMYLLPFTAPQQRLQDYTLKENQESNKLIQQTEGSSV